MYSSNQGIACRSIRMFGVTSCRHRTCGSLSTTTSLKPCTLSASATSSANHTLYVKTRTSFRGSFRGSLVPARSASMIPEPPN